MINAPLIPTRLSTLSHAPPWPGVKLFSTYSLLIFRVLVLKPLFLFLLVDIVPVFFSAHHLPPSCDVATGGASAGGDGGEAVTFKPRLSNPSLSDALGTLKQDRRKKRTTGREGADILDGK